MNRRNFLSLFCAAPFAAPALAKEAARGMASGGYLRGVSGVVGTMRSAGSVSSLSIKLDTSEIDAAIVRVKEQMSHFPDLSNYRVGEPITIRAGSVPVSATRRGDWMQTANGRQAWPMDPRPEDIHIDDIAAALSKLCRYGGHCRKFYSVAEHCVLMASVAPEGLQLAALMHDASEAYLNDVIRPIKRHLTNYETIEAELERAIAARFSLQWPMPKEVKRLDNAIITDEREQSMATPPVPWKHAIEPALGVQLHFWSPEKAEFEFLAAFRRYGGHWS